MIGLKSPYIQVEYGGTKSYGGSQMRSDRAVIRKCGCGPVAALDTVLYLDHRRRPESMSLADYNAALRNLCLRYFPLIPPFGINGLIFVAGLNRLLRDKGLPYRASWMLSGTKLWERTEEMLRHDLPVILSVGPNFPIVWQNNRLTFYVRDTAGRFRPAASAKGHFVTATGIDEDWVRISSWGREYYINRHEYERYTRKNSSYLFSNLVYLRKTEGNNGSPD